jgi:hypothetical protein
MAKVKHYVLDQIVEDDFSLIAIHCNCEGYLLAFLLNSNCQSKFTRSKKNKDEPQKKFPFESYEWIDPIKGIEIRLFSNRCLIFQNDPQKGTSLFDLPETKELYLIKDLKDADYIIKINSGIEAKVLIEKMEAIEEISYSFLSDQSESYLDFSLNLD